MTHAILTAVLDTASFLLPLLVFALYGYHMGAHHWRNRAGNTLVHLQQNLNELGPAMQWLGIGPSFDYAIVDLYGRPPKFLRGKLVKGGVPLCGECGHFQIEHRPTITVLDAGDAASGEPIPVSANLICKHVRKRFLWRKAEKCRCVQRLRDGYVQRIDVHIETDDD